MPLIVNLLPFNVNEARPDYLLLALPQNFVEYLRSIKNITELIVKDERKCEKRLWNL